MKKQTYALITASLFLTLQALTSHAELTQINITNEILVKDTIRMGINLNDDTYSSGPILMKMRTVENFEGSLFRQCHWGPTSESDGFTTWFTPKKGWEELALNSTAVILSGPQQWEKRSIIELGTKPHHHKGKEKDAFFFRFDKPIIPQPVGSGFMIIADRPKQGHAVAHNKFWNTSNNTLEHGDTPPGSFGYTSLRLAGSQGSSHYTFTTNAQRYGDNNGTWKVRFWAKNRSADSAHLQIIGQGLDSKPEAQVKTTLKWTQFEETFKIKGVPEPKNIPEAKNLDRGQHLTFALKAETEDILIDDIEIWKEGDTNPTAFLDSCVNALKEYRPGILRHLQMGGSTLDNILSPRLRMRTYASQSRASTSPYCAVRRHTYSMPEFFVLCEEIRAEPWYSLPGTILPEELEQFLEYVAGSTKTPNGRRRAKDGHPKPWTDTFAHIHVEFGNEAWNSATAYKCSGFNGPDYWRNLIEEAKKSPNYRKNIVFHAGGQAANSHRTQSIMRKTPNADCFAVGPYVVHELNKEELPTWENDHDIFRWLFAWPIDRSISESGTMFENGQHARKAGIELSTYEINYHVTGGDAPLEDINKLVNSLGGGIGLANSMMLMLREQHMRNQCLFTFSQHSYRTSVGRVHLWGTALNTREGLERYRPTFLANQVVNRVIGGDMVKTTHSSNEPQFTATGRFENRKTATKTFPTLWTYAFQKGKQRSLILFNLDTKQAQDVKINFEGRPTRPAKTYTLTADKITANNEFENKETQVHILEQTRNNFRSGSRMKIPPHSMIAIKWLL